MVNFSWVSLVNPQILTFDDSTLFLFSELSLMYQGTFKMENQKWKALLLNVNGIIQDMKW